MRKQHVLWSNFETPNHDSGHLRTLQLSDIETTKEDIQLKKRTKLSIKSSFAVVIKFIIVQLYIIQWIDYIPQPNDFSHPTCFVKSTRSWKVKGVVMLLKVFQEIFAFLVKSKNFSIFLCKISIIFTCSSIQPSWFLNNLTKWIQVHIFRNCQGNFPHMAYFIF